MTANNNSFAKVGFFLNAYTIIFSIFAAVWANNNKAKNLPRLILLSI